MFIKDGKRFNIDAAVTIGDVQYPSGYFRDPITRAEHGITELPEPARGNEDFYFNQEIDESPFLLVTPRPLDQVKLAVWEKIKTYRDNLQARGYKVGDHWFHSDEKSKIQQLALVMVGANVPPVKWKTMSGDMVTMSPELASQIFQAAMQQEMTIFAVAEMHRAAIELLETVEEVAVYDWSTSWPEVYED